MERSNESRQQVNSFSLASQTKHRSKHRTSRQHCCRVLNIACAECVENSRKETEQKFVFEQHTKRATRLSRKVKQARLRDVHANEIQSRGIRNGNICKADQQRRRKLNVDGHESCGRRIRTSLEAVGTTLDKCLSLKPHFSDNTVNQASPFDV